MSSNTTLTPEEILASNNQVASPFQVSRLKRNAAKNWDIFWKQNQTKFFRDRHWIKKEVDIFHDILDTNSKKVLLEVGCGVGNFLYPIIEENPSLKAHACDFSPRAIQMLKENELYDPEKVNGFVYDITTQDPDQLGQLIGSDAQVGLDMIVCLFVLSAIPSEKHGISIENLTRVLAPGGKLFFRDYALHDEAQLRFHSRRSAAYAEPNLLSNDTPLYTRQDGTMSYFFTPDEVNELMRNSGFDGESQVVIKEMRNRKDDWQTQRRFVQGVFTKRK